jgi:LysM repeat protein
MSHSLRLPVRPRAKVCRGGGRLTGVLAALAWIALLAPGPAMAAPNPNRASDLIQAVNEYRATQGMAPLTVDPILMQVAQRQNDYSISIGQITHYGPDGSRPKEQAIAAGYGGGKTVFVSENIQMGTGLSPDQAVQIWTGDDPHLNTMIGQYYRDIGAAAGEKDGMVYYTLLTGYVAGGYSAKSTVPVAQPAAPVYVPPPIVVATPQANGSIVHVVQPGQVLWAIADAYNVRIQDLVILNHLGLNAILYPGDEILIRAALTPTATATALPTTTPSATPTETPSPPTSTPGPASDLEGGSGTPSRTGVSPGARVALVLLWVGILAAGAIVVRRRS